MRWNTLVHLAISLRENQPATHAMLQKEIINDFRKPAWQYTKLLLKIVIISDLRDTWSNRLWLSLAKQSLIWDSYLDQKLKIKDNFPNIFDFTIL